MPMTVEEFDALWRQMKEDRDEDAQPGFTGRQVMIETPLRVPFLSTWIERRRARRS